VISHRKGKEKQTISHQELQRAIQRFLKEGGMIQKLPDQKSVAHSHVGHRWGNSEMFEN